MQLLQHELQHARAGLRKGVLTKDVGSFHVERDQRRVLFQGAFALGVLPLGVIGKAEEHAVLPVEEVAQRHDVEGVLDQRGQIVVERMLAPLQGEVERLRMGELGSVADAAVHAIERACDEGHGFGRDCGRKHTVRGFLSSLRLPPLLFQRAELLADGVAILAVLCGEFHQKVAHLLHGNICRARHEFAFRCQKGRGRPAAAVVAPVDVGPRGGIHPHGHKIGLDEILHGIIGIGALVHEMRPLAPRRGEAKQNRPVAGLCFRKSSFRPRAPGDEVGAVRARREAE